MRKWALLALVPLLLPSLARAEEPDPAFTAAVNRLMEATGSAQLGHQMGIAVVAQMASALRKARPDIPPRAFQVIEEVTLQLLQTESPTLLARMVPIYARHFTLAEVEQIIAFYDTPLGRKTIQVMPALMSEAIQLSQGWALALQPRLEALLLERLKQEQLIPANARNLSDA
jgi:hypothetical protein